MVNLERRVEREEGTLLGPLFQPPIGYLIRRRDEVVVEIMQGVTDLEQRG